MSTFYFPYVGNKRTETKYLKDYILNLVKTKNIKRIVEPFCGSCSFSLYCYYELGLTDIQYILNDSDRRLIKMLDYVKCKTFLPFMNAINSIISHLTKEMHNDIIKRSKEYPDSLFHYIYYNKIYNYRKGLYPAKVKKLDYSRFSKLDDFFALDQVKLLNDDYRLIFNLYGGDQHALIFLDPPYFNSANNFYDQYQANTYATGEIIDNTAMYVDIVKLLKNDSSVIGILNSPEILRYMYTDYVKEYYNKIYQLTRKGGKKKNTEHMIISNFNK